MNQLVKIIDAVNVSKHLSDHLVGKHHTDMHRRGFGFLIMALGVALVNLGRLPELHIIHYASELIGGAMHGIGLIPYASSVEHGRHLNRQPPTITKPQQKAANSKAILAYCGLNPNECTLTQ